MNDDFSCVQFIALEAGELALKHFRNPAKLSIEAKGPLDLVTTADRAVEAYICDALARSFPKDGIFGEEGSTVVSQSGRTWVIDPIDGTFNFVRGNDGWGISIGLLDRGRPVLGLVNTPARGELFSGGDGLPALVNGMPLQPLRPFCRAYAAIGVGIHPSIPNAEALRLLDHVINDLNLSFRITGSTVISLIDIAKGAVDGYLGRGIPCWDILGMLPVLESMNIRANIDWRTAGLPKHINFVCGRSEVVSAIAELAP